MKTDTIQRAGGKGWLVFGQEEHARNRTDGQDSVKSDVLEHQLEIPAEYGEACC